MPRVPRRLLVNDEGSSALHHLDFDAPTHCWTSPGPGRDLQLIGGGGLLRSTPRGYVELALSTGKVLREVKLDERAGGIESARRLPNGNTIVLGNTPHGILMQELDPDGAPVRQLLGEKLEKGRLVRLTSTGTLLFCSDGAGKRLIHEATFEGGVKTLFEIPADVAADSMLKAVRTGPEEILVSSGYAASLLRIDTAHDSVKQTIGGKAQPEPSGARRELRPFFFSGFQLFDDGDLLLANWQGHGPGHGHLGYQLLMYSADGTLLWHFDQTEYPHLGSLNNVLALDDLDTNRLHDEPQGVLVPVG